MVYLFKKMYRISPTRNKTDLAFQKFIISSKGKTYLSEGFELKSSRGSNPSNPYIRKAATTPHD